MEFTVDVNGLIKIYEGKVRALDSVNLKVEAGKVFALLSPNGASKTACAHAWEELTSIRKEYDSTIFFNMHS